MDTGCRKPHNDREWKKGKKTSQVAGIVAIMKSRNGKAKLLSEKCDKT